MNKEATPKFCPLGLSKKSFMQRIKWLYYNPLKSSSLQASLQNGQLRVTFAKKKQGRFLPVFLAQNPSPQFVGPIITTAELVENQFIWLFEQMENGYKKLLNL